MNADPSAQRRLRTVLLISGLMDMLLGAAFLLAWAGLLPVNLVSLDIPPIVAGAVGAILFLFGTGMAVYQLTKPMPPD